MSWQSWAGGGPCVSWLSCLAVLPVWPYCCCVWNCLGVCAWAETQSQNNFQSCQLCFLQTHAPHCLFISTGGKRGCCWITLSFLNCLLHQTLNTHSTECYNVHILVELGLVIFFIKEIKHYRLSWTLFVLSLSLFSSPFFQETSLLNLYGSFCFYAFTPRMFKSVSNRQHCFVCFKRVYKWYSNKSWFFSLNLEGSQLWNVRWFSIALLMSI